MCRIYTFSLNVIEIHFLVGFTLCKKIHPLSHLLGFILSILFYQMCRIYTFCVNVIETHFLMGFTLCKKHMDFSYKDRISCANNVLLKGSVLGIAGKCFYVIHFFKAL